MVFNTTIQRQLKEQIFNGLLHIFLRYIQFTYFYYEKMGERKRKAMLQHVVAYITVYTIFNI